MTLTQPIPLILASGSAVRQQMLRGVGLQCSVMVSGCDEEALKDSLASLPIPQRALALARAKAASVAGRYPGHITIGADQMCAHGEEVLSKPGSYERAHEQLRRLSGTTHRQVSAAVLMRGEELLWSGVEEAQLTMRALTDAEIDWYLRQDAPLQSCGSYRLEGMGKHLFSCIEGNQDTIMGLPLAPLLAELYRVGAVGVL